MDSLASVLLSALIQGATEFLPVSSSGHLVLVRALTGLEEARVALEVVLHLGTLLSVVVFFRRRLLALGRDAWSGPGPGRRWLLAVAVGSVPAGAAGLLLEGFFTAAFGSLAGTSCCLLAMSLALWFLSPAPRREEGPPPSPRQALLVGLAQAVAILPGISRSGSTILAGIRGGLDRRTAGEFSFFLSLPAIAGATVLEARKIGAAELPWSHLLLGGAVAFLVGYLCLGLLMWLLREGRLRLFAPWCLAAGALGLALTGRG